MSASKIKALLLCLEDKKGAAAAEAWLGKVRFARGDVDDETRMLPLHAYHAALEAFVAEAGAELDVLAPYLVTSENLGVWARVLRGTRAAEHAFARIESSDSEHGRTTRWETLEAVPGRWRGRVRIGHDPGVEKDGLLAKARAVDLAVVPTLFGFPRGEVKTITTSEDAQEFEVRWGGPTPFKGVLAGALGGVVVGGATFAALPSTVGALVALFAPIAGGCGGFAMAQSGTRRIEQRAQSMRVSALERSLALRDLEDRASAGDLEGSVVAGQYRIGVRMGSGASGVIYQATRLTDGLKVAIKLLRAATAHDAVASDRLRREAEALGLSWHPNVVEVIDHGHLPDGTSYLVMELLEGEMLATFVKERHRLRLAEALPYAIQVVDALVAIHAAGVVHRDLKPSNIYLVDDPSVGRRAKILDFGIARVEWEEMRITNMGAPMGTPGYMSPEQESGGEVDARSDIFAFGALLYECLVGEPPPPSRGDFWKPNTRLQSVGIRAAEERALTPRGDSGVHPASRRLPSAAPAPLEEGEVDAPAMVRAIVEKALEKRPEDRFQDARSLLVALRALNNSSEPGSVASST